MTDIVFVIESMGGGGSQRVASALLDHWVQSGKSVALITFRGEVTDVFDVDARVKRYVIGGALKSSGIVEAVLNNFRRALAIRRVLKGTRTPLVVSFVTATNVLTILATLGLGLRVVVSERNDPLRQNIGLVWSFLRRLSYRFADHVTANTAAALAAMHPYVLADRLSVVPNPVRGSRGEHLAKRNGSLILAVGRLHPQKGHEMLIKAFARISQQLPDWYLRILGDGPLRESLQALIDKLNLGDRIELHGHVADPFPHYRAADIFVMASRYEGMPNALLEAMSCGKAVIITDCLPGAREVVKANETGLVVPAKDIDALAAALEHLAQDCRKRARLGEAAAAEVACFRPENALAAWDRIIWPQRATKVLFIIGELALGGAEHHLLLVLPRLRNYGIHPTVYTLLRRGELAQEFEAVGIDVIGPWAADRVANLPRLLRRIFGLPLSMFSLFWEIRRLRPTIVHMFLPAAYLLGTAPTMLAGATIRIMSRRSLNLYQRHYPFVRTLETLFHRHMSAILGNSQAVIKDLFSENAPKDRVCLLYNGIDLNDFRISYDRHKIRESLEIREDDLVFIIVANLIGYKGHADLIEALALANERLPLGWVLLCVGRDNGIGTNLARLSDERGVGLNIKWLGQRRDIPCLLAASDVGILCSHEEGFSNALLEYMAAGLPIVATKVGGNGDAIQEDISGLLVQPGNPWELSAALLRLAGDRAQREAMGKAARERVLKFFSLEACVEKYVSVYRSLEDGTALPTLDGEA